MRRRRIGILGGMGPLATVDFMRKIIDRTDAQRDQDHVPMVVYSVPQIPDRVSAILEGRDDPFPMLLDGIRALEQANAEVIVMPCNTAHAWFDRLAASTDVPMLHIAEAVRSTLRRNARPPKRLGLLATRGTTMTGIYQRALTTDDCEVVEPDHAAQALLTAVIAAVKRGEIAEAERVAKPALDDFAARGCDALLLACTELPLAIRAEASPLRIIDATASLADACMAFSLAPEDNAKMAAKLTG